MGRRGPAKEPTKLKILKGTAKASALATEPQPRTGAPEPDSSVPAEAAAIYRAVVAVMPRDFYTKADDAALEMFGRTFRRYRACEQFNEEHGLVMTVRDDKGNVKWTQPTPQASLSVKILPQLRALAAELGLSPAARARLTVAAAPEASALDRFLAGGRRGA